MKSKMIKIPAGEFYDQDKGKSFPIFKTAWFDKVMDNGDERYKLTEYIIVKEFEKKEKEVKQ